MANDKAARKIVGALAHKDPCKTLAGAIPWLVSINETAEFGLQRRFELIDLIDNATRVPLQRVADSFVTLPQAEPQAMRLWQAASEYWNLLGDAYLACARQYRGAMGIADGTKPGAPMLAARGLRALRHQLKWVLLRYGAPRSEFWVDCGRLVMLAEAVDGAAQPVDIFGDMVASPNDELLRLMAFWTAAPSGLSPVEQDIAERLVLYLTPKLRCSAGVTDGDDYFFDVDGSRPPLRVVPSAPVNAATRFFDVSGARDTLGAIRAIVSSAGNLPPGLQWGPSAPASAVLRVLRHLRTHWAKEMPPRGESRRKTQEPLYAAYGFDDVLARVAPEMPPRHSAGELSPDDEWIAEDMSAGGCGVIVPHGKGDTLRVGMLVAMRTRAEAAWRLGIIRRVNELKYRQHRLGIQVISTAAAPVSLRAVTGAKRGRERAHGLFLGAQPSPAGHVYVIMRHGQFGGGETVEAFIGDRDAPVTLQAGGVLESGHDFDWLYYPFPERPA